MNLHDNMETTAKKTPLLDYSMNGNPLGMPESVIKALKYCGQQCMSFFDNSCSELYDRIAAFENVNRNNIICVSSASDMIYRIVNAVRPKHAVLFSPVYSGYERALISADCDITYIDTSEDTDFSVTSENAEHIPDNTDIVFLCSPNYPTGRIVEDETLTLIIEKCRSLSAKLVVDERFIDYCPNAAECTAKRFLDDGVIIIKDLAELFSFTGLRLGYALCADSQLLYKMSLAGPEWPITAPAYFAACAALDDEEYIQLTRRYVERERNYLTECFENLSFSVIPSQGNFLLVKTRIPISDILEQKYRITIGRCDDIRGLDGNFYRFGIKNHGDNDRLVYSLGKGVFSFLKPYC